jgi:hypothetical protein
MIEIVRFESIGDLSPITAFTTAVARLAVIQSALVACSQGLESAMKGH